MRLIGLPVKRTFFQPQTHIVAVITERIMNPLVRRVLAILSGVVVSGLVIGGVEMLGHSLFGVGGAMPDQSDAAAVRAYAEGMSFAALASLLVGWCAGAYVGSLLAIRIARGSERLMTLIVGGFVLFATVMNFFDFPHPLWLMVSAIILIPVCAWLAMPRQPKAVS